LTRNGILAVPGSCIEAEENALGPSVAVDGGEGIALRTVGDSGRTDVDGRTGDDLANGGTGRRCRRLLNAFRRRQAERTPTAAGGVAGADAGIVVAAGRSRSSTPSLSVKECKATRTLGVIMGAFTACWLPFFVEGASITTSELSSFRCVCLGHCLFIMTP